MADWIVRSHPFAHQFSPRSDAPRRIGSAGGELRVPHARQTNRKRLLCRSCWRAEDLSALFLLLLYCEKTMECAGSSCRLYSGLRCSLVRIGRARRDVRVPARTVAPHPAGGKPESI